MSAAGLQITPSDSTGAIGPSHYVEMVNSRIAVYDRSLNPVSSTTLGEFVGQASTVPYCDPQVQWVPTANRWLFAFLYCGGGTQFFVLGWSQGPDPSVLSPSGWCGFVVITDPYLFDFPKLGHNSNFLIVGGNFYANPTAASPSFVSAGIGWVPIGDSACTPPHFVGTTNNPLKNGDGVSNTFTPVPVNTYSAAPDGYIVSAYDPSGSNGQTPAPQAKVAVWHLTATGTLMRDNDVVVNSYDTPTAAPQQATPYLLDTLPGMFTQAVGDPMKGFYTQHTVGGPLSRSEVDWYEFVVSGPNVVLAQQGKIVDPSGDWVFNAAISPRFDGLGAAIVYNRSSLNTAPLIAAQIRYQATPLDTMAAGELIVSTGVSPVLDYSCVGPYGPPCRWGDYSAATPDPIQPTLVWGTNVISLSATATTPSWATVNFAIAPTPEAPTNVRALSVRSPGRINVSWTPGAYDPIWPPTSYTVIAYIGGPGGGVAGMTVAAPATTAYFTGLTPGVTYVFNVTANSAAGPSLASALSNAVMPGDPVQQSTANSPPLRDSVKPAPAPPSPPAR